MIAGKHTDNGGRQDLGGSWEYSGEKIVISDRGMLHYS
jgi:hypothetical protein